MYVYVIQDDFVHMQGMKQMVVGDVMSKPVVAFPSFARVSQIREVGVYTGICVYVCMSRHTCVYVYMYVCVYNRTAIFKTNSVLRNSQTTVRTN